MNPIDAPAGPWSTPRMPKLVLTLFISTFAHAQYLERRLAVPSCQEMMSKTSRKHARQIADWARQRSAAVFEGPREILVHSSPSVNSEVAFELLIELALATPPPFATRRVPDTDWQLNVWSKTALNATRESALLGDLIVYDRTSQNLSAGEFVIAVRFDSLVGPAVLEGLIGLALSRTGIPINKLKGLRAPGTSNDAGTVYLIIDLIGDAAFRYQETLRLMKHINLEFGDLKLDFTNRI